MKEDSMDCPRCGLVNPPTAQRCDCGYDFLSRKVETPCFRQGLPTTIKAYIALVVVANVLMGLRAILSQSVHSAIVAVLFATAVYPLYLQLLKKKSWARTALAVLTFPVGTALLLTREVKLYMLQKD
jgi:Flp pilus assembly protein TadB